MLLLPLLSPAAFEDGQTLLLAPESVPPAFHRFSLLVSAPSPLRGQLTYEKQGAPYTEEFFLPVGENVFTSFVDGFLSGETAGRPASLSFTGLNGQAAGTVKLISFTTEARPDERVYLENGQIKVGASLRFGGGLDYLEALTGQVAAANVCGRAAVAPGLAARVPAEQVITGHVNLLNCHDTGRLVQQSYYGTDAPPYEKGEFMGLAWRYNPVMGGDKSNTASKIIDFSVTGGENPSLYVKCRPQDWGHANRPVPAYMEAFYTLDGPCLRVDNRFTDFSGLPHPVCHQELPAFYAVEPLDRLYYYDNGLQSRDDLPFWHRRGERYPSSENWWAWTNREEDGFGVGLLTPGVTNAVAGIYKQGEALSAVPAESDPTVYVAPLAQIALPAFAPFSYSYLLCVGRLSEILQNFEEKRPFLPVLDTTQYSQKP